MQSRTTQRISTFDPWGPAGAIVVRGGFRTLTGLPVPARTGSYPDERTAAQAAVEDRLADGKTAGKAHVDLYRLLSPIAPGGP